MADIMTTTEFHQAVTEYNRHVEYGRDPYMLLGKNVHTDKTEYVVTWLWIHASAYLEIQDADYEVIFHGSRIIESEE